MPFLYPSEACDVAIILPRPLDGLRRTAACDNLLCCLRLIALAESLVLRF